MPQFAFAHFGAGVKASVVFLRKREEGETPNDDEAIFMALAENIGYDATGRKTFKTVKSRIEGNSRIDVLRCDLFDMQIVYEHNPENPDEWIERHREVIRDSGLLVQYRKFRENPEPFFA